jgi:hypothetical protein
MKTAQQRSTHMTKRKSSPENADIIKCDIDSFTEELKNDIESGIGFIPLIGSGMSADSGIPAGNQYEDYLFHCIRKAIDNKNSFHPMKWPPLHDMPLYYDYLEEKRKWAVKKLREIKKIDDKEEKQIIMQATGVLADWRACLNFLSRLRTQREENSNVRLTLGAPDRKVIDSFFLTITKGKQPNIAHMILAHLVDALRIRVILTTNFDTLIEQAFQQLSVPLASFDVHYDAGMPDPRFVLAQRSLVKLHGGRYGLRADYSLDRDPTEIEKKCFLGYLTADTGRDSVTYSQRKNVLVMGISGRDKRIMQLLHYACEKIKGIKIYWIKYDENETFDFSYLDNSSRLSRSIHTLTHQQLDFFLLQLYQNIFYSLPPSGVKFPAFWRVPYLRGTPITKDETKDYNTCVTELVKKIKKSIDESSPNEEKKRKHTIATDSIFVYPSTDSSPQAKIAHALCTDVFNEFSTRYHCLWLDLHYFKDAEQFFILILDAIVRKMGIRHFIPPQLTQTENSNGTMTSIRKTFDFYTRYPRHATKRFIIFLDGIEEENTLIDKKNINELKKLINICDSSDIVFVFMFPKRNYQESLTNEIRKNWFPISLELPLEENIDEAISSFITSYDKDDTDCFADNEHIPFYKSRFLYSLTLYGQSRYWSSLVSWASLKAPESLRIDGEDNDRQRADIAARWLKELEDAGLTHKNSGGAVFIYEDVKKNIQEYLEKKIVEIVNDNKVLCDYQDISVLRAECHQGIADWYVKLFRTSGDPLTVFESIKHRLDTIEYRKKYLKRNMPDYIDNGDEVIDNALNEIEITIQLASNRLKGTALTQSFSGMYFAQKEHFQILKRFLNKRNKWKQKVTKIQTQIDDIFEDYFSDIGEYDNALRTNKKLRPRNKLKYSRRRAMHYMHKRCYEIADELYRKHGINNILKDNSIKMASWDISLDLERKDQIRQRARCWINEWRTVYEESTDEDNNGNFVKEVIKILRRYHFLMLLKAQALRLIGKNTFSVNVRDGIHTRRKRISYNDLLQRAESIYITATEMMRYTNDKSFIQHENAIIRSHYGVQLGLMKRYWEGHRRLNEAAAYFEHAAEGDNGLGSSINDLRRTELYLTAISDIYKAGWPDEEAKSQISGFLYDAIVSLERAGRRLSLHSLKIWWLSLLYEMQMQVCVEVVKLRDIKGITNENDKDIFHRCERCISCGERFTEIIQRALFIVKDDVLRIARYLDMAMEFYARNFENTHSGIKDKLFYLIVDLEEKLRTSLKTFRKNEWKGLSKNPVLDKHADQYIRNILRVAKFLTDKKQNLIISLKKIRYALYIKNLATPEKQQFSQDKWCDCILSKKKNKSEEINPIILQSFTTLFFKNYTSLYDLYSYFFRKATGEKARFYSSPVVLDSIFQSKKIARTFVTQFIENIPSLFTRYMYTKSSSAERILRESALLSTKMLNMFQEGMPGKNVDCKSKIKTAIENCKEIIYTSRRNRLRSKYEKEQNVTIGNHTERLMIYDVSVAYISIKSKEKIDIEPATMQQETAPEITTTIGNQTVRLYYRMHRELGGYYYYVLNLEEPLSEEFIQSL